MKTTSLALYFAKLNNHRNRLCSSVFTSEQRKKESELQELHGTYVCHTASNGNQMMIN